MVSKIKNCNYPNCTNCEKEDCDMDEKDIKALLKRRIRELNPEKERERQREYRKRKRENLPNCNECKNCILVEKEKREGYRRLCIDKLKLIEQKVTNSPQWCSRRTPSKDYLKRREKILEQKKEKYNLRKS